MHCRRELSTLCIPYVTFIIVGSPDERVRVCAVLGDIYILHVRAAEILLAVHEVLLVEALWESCEHPFFCCGSGGGSQV